MFSDSGKLVEKKKVSLPMLFRIKHFIYMGDFWLIDSYIFRTLWMCYCMLCALVLSFCWSCIQHRIVSKIPPLLWRCSLWTTTFGTASGLMPAIFPLGLKTRDGTVTDNLLILSPVCTLQKIQTHTHTCTRTLTESEEPQVSFLKLEWLHIMV